MIQRETVEQVLGRSTRMVEAIEMDVRVRPLLIKASREASYNDRWQTYEDLKREAKTVIGYHASQAVLRDEVYYKAFIDAIDALLPQHENDFVILVPRQDEPRKEDEASA